jgi:hypothetical protein
VKQQPRVDEHGNLLCPVCEAELQAIEVDHSVYLELYCWKGCYAIYADDLTYCPPWL